MTQVGSIGVIQVKGGVAAGLVLTELYEQEEPKIADGRHSDALDAIVHVPVEIFIPR